VSAVLEAVELSEPYGEPVALDRPTLALAAVAEAGSTW
jgi:hypothetical protein